MSRWANTQIVSDFGAVVTAHQGGAASFTFRIPLGIIPASEVSQVALAFYAEAPPVGTPQGSMMLSVDIGIAPVGPGVQNEDAYAPLAQTLKGVGTRLVVSALEELYTNRIYEFEVLAPQQPALVPLYLRVEAASTIGSPDPTIWSALSAAVVSLALGVDDTEAANQAHDEQLQAAREAAEAQRISFESPAGR